MSRDSPDLPLVTIGIPTYNRADGYLRECLSSALQQTYPRIEVIVSDNCSQDGTQAYMEGISDPRLRYVRHEENIGPANNFNFCLDAAEGEYFLLLHDDDLIDEDFVEACLREARYRTDVGIIMTGTRVIDGAGSVVKESPNRSEGLSTEEFFKSWFRGGSSWYLCSTLFSTGGLRQIGGFHSRNNLTQDGVAIVKLVPTLGRVAVEEVKASFRKHANEITFSVDVKDWAEDYLDLLDLMCDAVPDSNGRFRREGLRFLCRINYNRASAVKPTLKRLATYLMVYRSFNYCLSPMTYIAWPYLRRKNRQLRRLIGKSWSGSDESISRSR